MWTCDRSGYWRRLFFINYYNSMAMSFVTKLNFWRGKSYDPLLVQLVLNGCREASLRSFECRLFELSVFEHIYSDFLKITEFTFPVIQGLFRMEYSKPMVLSSFFLDVSVIRHNRRIFCHQCVFPKDWNKHIRTASLLFCRHNCISFQTSLIVEDLKQSWSFSCTFLSLL